MATETTTFYQHRIKCLACGLHFTVHSDYADWPMHSDYVEWPKGVNREQRVGESAGLVYCPECGETAKKLIYAPVEVEGFIFQQVPGGEPGAPELRELR